MVLAGTYPGSFLLERWRRLIVGLQWISRIGTNSVTLQMLVVGILRIEVLLENWIKISRSDIFGVFDYEYDLIFVICDYHYKKPTTLLHYP